MLEYTRSGTMHFVLSRVRDNQYAKHFFRSEKKHKILDNGVYETGFPLDGETLLKLADEIKADEVIAPDFFKNQTATYEATKYFLESFDPKSKGLKVCVVPQAHNPLEFVEAYKRMKQFKVDVIALPVWLQKHFKARPSIVGYLRKKRIWDETKEHHLLGLDGIGELYAYEKGIIRSVDTSLPFSLTYAHQFESFGDFTGKRIPFDIEPFQSMQLWVLRRHIDQLLNAAAEV